MHFHHAWESSLGKQPHLSPHFQLRVVSHAALAGQLVGAMHVSVPQRVMPNEKRTGYQITMNAILIRGQTEHKRPANDTQPQLQPRLCPLYASSWMCRTNDMIPMKNLA